LKHYLQLTEELEKRVFYKSPLEFNKDSHRELLGYALGATLYMPSHKDVAHKIITGKFPGLTTFVMCFEDAIRAEDLKDAEAHVLEVLNTFVRAVEQGLIISSEIPLFFLRVRNIEQFKDFTSRLTKRQAQFLTGFIFPKFTAYNGSDYLNHTKYLNERLETTLYGMPILESKEIIYTETRNEQLFGIQEIVNNNKDLVLNVRAGGTDFSSLFGLRRGIDYSIYDIHVVKEALLAILNCFARAECSYVIPGVVWEYFADHPVRQNNLVSKDKAYQGLIKEVNLDKINGFVGKTIIHPSHISIVNAFQIVSEEEYKDAVMIVKHQGGGVLKGTNGNKMNETNPHLAWAKNVLLKSDAYGVLKEGVSYEELF